MVLLVSSICLTYYHHQFLLLLPWACLSHLPFYLSIPALITFSAKIFQYYYLFLLITFQYLIPNPNVEICLLFYLAA